MPRQVLVSNGRFAVRLDDKACIRDFYFPYVGLENHAVGELRSFRVREREVLVANVDGKFFCLDGRCTHAGAPLAEGSLSGEVLTCPWHYSQFDITNGLVLRGPAYKPLKSYRLEEREDYIFIDL